MKVENKEMYHYHAKNNSDDLWKKGNIIKIDKDFESNLIRRWENSSTYYINGKNEYELVNSLDYNIDKLNNPEFIDELRNLSEEDFIDCAKDLGRYFKTVNGILINYLCRDREYIMEMVRQKYYPNLPSRYNSIWLCDDKSKDFWNTRLRNNKVLYNVSLSGNLFKSSDAFIPNYRLPLYVMEELSHNYWNPKFETEEQEMKAEYLFQGEVKVLKRINKRSTRKL